jgi:hypothetical protein
MPEPVTDAFLGDHVDIATGIVQALAFEDRDRDPKPFADRMVQRDIPCGQTAPMLLSGERDVMVARQRFERFNFEKSDFVHVRLRSVSAGVDAPGIAVPGESDASDALGTGAVHHRGTGFGVV